MRRFSLWGTLVLIAICTIAKEVDADPCLTEERIRQSVRMNHPLLASNQNLIKAALAQRLFREGNFDAKLKVQGKDRTFGFFNGHYLDSFVEKPFQDFGAKVFGGYRFSDGDYPDYEGDFVTGEDGEFFTGFALSLLRNRDIDDARGALAVSELEIAIADIRLQAVKVGLNYALMQSYYSWRAELAKRSIYNSLLTQAKQRGNQLEVQVEAGDKPRIDLIDNQRVVVKRSVSLQKNQAAIAKKAAKLSLFYRDERGNPLTPSRTECKSAQLYAKARAVNMAHYGRSDLEERGFKQRPELKELDLLIEQAKVKERQGENDLMPALDFSVETGSDIGKGKSSSNDTEVKVGMKFEFPLQTRKGEGKRDEAVAKQLSLRDKQRFQRDKISAEIQTALVNLQFALERLKLATQEANLAQKVADAEREKFSLGDSNIITLNLREQYAAEALVGRVEAVLDVLLTVAELKATTGESL